MQLKFVAREGYRGPRLVAELASYGATFLCLQEVDADYAEKRTTLPAMLNDHPATLRLNPCPRYTWKFQKRDVPQRVEQANGPREGFALVWDSTRATPILPPYFINFDEGTYDEATHNGALLGVFRVDERAVCVACAYLHWDPNKASLKLRQARRLLKEIDAACTQLNVSSVIVAGDFNSVPGSEIYEAVRRADGTSLRRMWSAYQSYGVLEVRQVPQALQQTGGCTESSYRATAPGEPRYTNVNRYKRFEDTIDYIFFRGLQIQSVLQLPPGSETQALPNEHWCSDHVALAATFTLRPPASPS